MDKVDTGCIKKGITVVWKSTGGGKGKCGKCGKQFLEEEERKICGFLLEILSYL